MFASFQPESTSVRPNTKSVSLHYPRFEQDAVVLGECKTAAQRPTGVFNCVGRTKTQRAEHVLFLRICQKCVSIFARKVGVKYLLENIILLTESWDCTKKNKQQNDRGSPQSDANVLCRNADTKFVLFSKTNPAVFFTSQRYENLSNVSDCKTCVRHIFLLSSTYVNYPTRSCTYSCNIYMQHATLVFHTQVISTVDAKARTK